MINWLKYLLLGITICVSHFNIISQNIDSLKLEFQKAKNDTTKLKLRLELGEITSIYRVGYWDSIYIDARKLKNNIIEAKALNNIGFIYDKLGDIPKALSYYHKSLKIEESIPDKQGVGICLINIAMIYYYQNDIKKTIEYYGKSLKIFEEIDDKIGIANALNGFGYICNKQKNTEKALEYYSKSLQIYEGINDKSGIANVLSNTASIYYEKGDYRKALENYYKSLRLQEEIGETEGIAITLNNLTKVMLNEGKMNKALTYGIRAMQISKELGFPDNIAKSALMLKKIYQKQGRYKDAFEMYDIEIKMRDSINNEKTQKATIEKELQYDFEKQEAVAKAEHKIELEKQKALANEKNHKQTLIIWSVGIGLLLVLIFTGFIFRSLKITKEQKIIIEQQKHMVEEKHKEITDSINYAERIQKALLASKMLLDENLKDYFILFKPKDIVSGDFYWASQTRRLTNFKNDDRFILVTADSTGHGVPGAIMSILNIACLDKAVSKNIDSPDLILNETRRLIIEHLKNDGSEEGGKDGMDGSLLVFDFKNNILKCAAANNPVWIVRNNSLIEIKPDRMPIGKHHNDSIPFTLHSMDLQKGDIIYTLTDGFADQFGGKNGKKYKAKQLQDFLISISNLPMETQKQKLDYNFNCWKGNFEQIDDICLIGIKIQ